MTIDIENIWRTADSVVIVPAIGYQHPGTLFIVWLCWTVQVEFGG